MRTVVTCDVCGSGTQVPCPSETRFLALPYPYRVVRCGSCGVRYMTPQPDLDGTYEEGYFEGADRYGHLIATKLQDFAALYPRLEAYTPGRRLLEIGSAMGHFLKLGRDRGWQVEGIEVSRWAARYSEAKFGVSVRVARIEDVPLPPAGYDVVMMSHVLEHLQSPTCTLRAVHRALAPNGILLAEVPNQFDDLYARVMGWWIRLRAARPFLFHNFFFTPPQFVRFVEGQGFRVLDRDVMRRTFPCVPGRIPGGQYVRRAFEVAGGLIGAGPICTVFAQKIA